MDKRLAKRHKRQVSRARENVKVSEPDVRTHEQIEAARKLSRPDLAATAGATWPVLPSDAVSPEKAETPAEEPGPKE